MKIKPRLDRKAILCNFVFTEEFLAQKVKKYFDASENILMQASTGIVPENTTDCYVIPVELLGTLSDTENRPSTWLPYIAYGSRFFLNEAFSRGASDFLKDPWECEELELRILKLFPGGNIYSLRNEEIIFNGIQAETRFGCVILSKSEMKILKALLKAKGSEVHRDVLFYTIWNKLPDNQSRVVDVHISSLRKKLKILFPSHEVIIHHIRKEGYLLE